MPKRVLKTKHGNIEMLGSGQQFVGCGTHPTGARYEWVGGLPKVIPTLTLEQFESLWARLEATFAIEPGTTNKASTKAEMLSAAIENDPVAVELIALGATVERDGKLRIPSCPFSDGHTPGGDDSIVYFPKKTGGYDQANLRCLHASCAGRTREDFLEALGVLPEPYDPRDDFEAIPQEAIAAEIEKRLARFTPVPDSEFKAGKSPGWLVKKVLPMAELGVIFGASGSGKSFFVLDLVGSIARGLDWCGRRTKPGKVVYIAAEGASGFRNRINAYCESNGIDKMGIHVIAAAPNFTEVKDIADLTSAIRVLGPVDLVVVDTLAQVSAGANENSGEDTSTTRESIPPRRQEKLYSKCAGYSPSSSGR